MPKPNFWQRVSNEADKQCREDLVQARATYLQDVQLNTSLAIARETDYRLRRALRYATTCEVEKFPKFRPDVVNIEWDNSLFMGFRRIGDIENEIAKPKTYVFMSVPQFVFY